MNIVLLSPDEATRGFLPDSPTARHLRDIVGAKAGDRVFVGIPDGPRGRATILSADSSGFRFSVEWETSIQERLSLAVIVGLPRPQTAKKVLHDLASMGVSRIDFFKSEKGDPAYATASLWRDGEANEHLRKGAEQAFSTLIPTLTVHPTLAGALTSAKTAMPAGSALVAPDIYETVGPLGTQFAGKPGAILALGPERGWSERERALLKESGYTLAHLGDRVLRVETAAVAAAAIALANLGCWQAHR